MGSNAIEFVNASTDIIKNELDIKCDTLWEDLPLDEDFVAKASKCGDIFLFENRTFTFACYFCRDKFSQYQQFTDHIQETHSILFKQYDAEDPQGTSCKLEQATALEPEISLDNRENENPDSGGSNLNGTEEFENLATKFDCAECGKSLRTKVGLRKHLKHHKNIDNTKPSIPKSKTEKQSVIKSNSDDLTNKNHLLRRIKDRSKTKAKQPGHFKCKHCDSFFFNQIQRKVHEDNHKSEKRFQCTECPKVFFEKRQLTRHLLHHTGERPYKCDICFNGYISKQNFATHMKRKHLNERPFKCDICEKTFFSNTQRTVHMRIHTGEKPYQCEECGASFSTQCQFSSHKIRNHMREKKIECKICNKMFLTKACLKEHMASHSDEKPFECNVCSATFARRRALRHHVKLHSDIKEYVCKICGKGFKQSPGLYSHMKTHGVVNEKKPSVLNEESSEY